MASRDEQAIETCDKDNTTTLPWWWLRMVTFFQNGEQQNWQRLGEEARARGFLEENESELGRKKGVGTSWGKKKKAFSGKAFRGSEKHPQVWILCKYFIQFFSFSLFFIILPCYLSIICCGLGFVEAEFISYLLYFVHFLVFFIPPIND